MSAETSINFEVGFMPGDPVWVMRENRPREDTIVKITLSAEVQPNTTKLRTQVLFSLGMTPSYSYSRDLIFRTKEELLKSL